MTDSSAKSNQSENTDFARVEIKSPFDRKWMEAFISSPERLLRINSQVEYSTFEKIGEKSWHIIGKFLATDKSFDARFEAAKTDEGLRLTYDDGTLKTFTDFAIKTPEQNTATLIVTDDYSGTSKKEREGRISEVDGTIIQWGNDLHRYLHQFKRWSWLPGWKWYMRRFWQKMKPSARRISFLILAISAGEFIIFLFVFTIFWLEQS